MSSPDSQPQPIVTTAPAEGGSSSTASPAAPLRGRRVPSHVGPARLSTVLLAVAFVAIGVLYLFVKPVEPAPAGSTGDPAVTSERRDRTTEAPATGAPPTTPPTTSESAPSPTETVPTEETTPGDATTSEVPTEPTETVEPTTPAETVAPTTAPAPTTAAPTS